MRRKRDVPGLDKALELLQTADDGPCTPEEWTARLQALWTLEEAGLLWRLEIYYRSRRAYVEAAWVTEPTHRVVLFRVFHKEVE